MTKNYNCIIMTQDEVAAICGQPIRFQNGYPIDPSMRMRKQLEDHLGRVIVTTRESTRHPEEIFLFLADSQVYYGLTGKRIAKITGTFDDFTIILTDIFEDCPNENPADLFQNYRYVCYMEEQQKLNQWFKANYS